MIENLLSQIWAYPSGKFVLAIVFISVVFFLLNMVVGILGGSDGDDVSDKPLWKDLNAPVNGSVTQIDGHTVQIDAGGRSYLVWKDRRGEQYAQRVVNGKPAGSLMRGDIARRIKREINSDL